MCVMSMVHDHYGQALGGAMVEGQALWGSNNQPNWPTLMAGTLTAKDVADLRQLIKDFREASTAAKRVDELTGQPDCVDPKKAELEERVAKLEVELERIKSAFSG